MRSLYCLCLDTSRPLKSTRSLRQLSGDGDAFDLGAFLARVGCLLAGALDVWCAA